MGSFVAFGEILLRLSSPGRELLLQTPRLDVWVGGAEANVATQMSKLGHQVSFVSRVPANDLGQAARSTLRGHGVDVRHVQVAGDRMGLYFATSGAGMRATEVIYDRARSSFAEAPASAWDWDAILAGADWLHLSGITPALGAMPAAAAIAAAEAASVRGVGVSYDGNWRAKLWARWDGFPRTILNRIVPHADLMFGDDRDVALLLGRSDFEGTIHDRRRAAAEAAFSRYPNLQRLASTIRQVEDADVNRLSARIDSRDDVHQTEEIIVAGIVDRIGGGDAFAAGVLHALRSGGDDATMARTGLALAALKHSLPGDASLFRQGDIENFFTGKLDVRR